MNTVLDEFEIAAGWTELPFRAVARKVSESGFPDLESLSVFLDAGVVPRVSREDNHNQLGESLEKYQRVLPNDLVFNKLRTWQGGFGISDYEGIVSPAYIIARPDRELIEPRFLGYLLKSKPYLAELTRLSKWMPPTQFDISWESIRDLKLRIPLLEEQRRIADFLDIQIEVINGIVANKKNQIRVNSEIVRTKLYESFSNNIELNGTYSLPYLDCMVHSHQQFGRIFDVSLGKMVQPEPKSESDVFVPYLNAASMSNLHEAPDQKMWVAPGDFKSSLVESGDLLVVEGGDVGNSLFYFGEPVIIQNSLHRVRALPNSSLSYAHAVLELVKNSNYFSIICNGATIRHLTLEKLRGLQVPYFQKDIQEEIGTEYMKFRESNEVLSSELTSAIALLEEYKSAVITGAVTGQFDVTTKGSVA
jgi:type I restriction enzyme S subunit